MNMSKCRAEVPAPIPRNSRIYRGRRSVYSVGGVFTIESMKNTGKLLLQENHYE